MLLNFFEFTTTEFEMLNFSIPGWLLRLCIRTPIKVSQPILNNFNGIKVNGHVDRDILGMVGYL